jgi:hypothetical protein
MRRYVVLEETPRVPLWAMLGVPAVAAFILYWPLLGAGFLGDDFGMLHAFDGCDGFEGMLRCVGHTFVSGVGPPSNQYRPLTMASFAVNAALGADAFGWHLVSVLLQAANAALVALLAWQLAGEDASRSRVAALMAGWLFAWFAPAVEATAWIAARFDGMALLWLLVAACAFVASHAWRDRYGLLSLAATVLSYMSKESATIGVPLILALAWWKQGSDKGLLRSLAGALRTALPWLLIAAAYFAFRRLLFGDPFRFFPGSSPLAILLGGEWLANVPAMLDWVAVALPETGPRIAFAWSGALLLVCALAAGVSDRTKGRALVAIVVAVLGAFALLLPHWTWAGNGEGGRVLLTIGAIAFVAAALPLAVAGRPRGLAWVAAIVLVGSQWMLAQAAVTRWMHAGEDTRALAATLAASRVRHRRMAMRSSSFRITSAHSVRAQRARRADAAAGASGLVRPKLIVQTDAELRVGPISSRAISLAGSVANP